LTNYHQEIVEGYFILACPVFYCDRNRDLWPLYGSLKLSVLRP